jgi:hypothetical protein
MARDGEIHVWRNYPKFFIRLYKPEAELKLEWRVSILIAPQPRGAVEILTTRLFYLNFFFDNIPSHPQLLRNMNLDV